jgi:hypothetical protein
MWHRRKGRSRKTHHHGTGEQAELYGVSEKSGLNFVDSSKKEM